MGDEKTKPIEPSSDKKGDMDDTWFIDEESGAGSAARPQPNAAPSPSASRAPGSETAQPQEPGEESPGASGASPQTGEPSASGAPDVAPGAAAEPPAPRSLDVAQTGSDNDPWQGESSESTRLIVDESLMDEAVSTDFSVNPIAPPAAASPLAPSLPELPAEPSRPAAHAEQIDNAKKRIAVCETEARAFGADKRAAPLWYEAGKLQEQVLQNPRQAATSYQAAFTADPSYVPVLHAAQALFGDNGNWPMVARLLEAELAVASDPLAQADLLTQLARLYEGKLAKPEQAEQRERKALEIQPGHLPAFEALLRRLRAAGRWSDLVALIESQAAYLDPAFDRRRALLEMAEIHERRLDAPDAALQIYRQLLSEHAGDLDAAAAQVRLLRRQDRPEALIDALVQHASILRGPPRASLLIEAARLCRGRLKQGDRALDLLERAKLASPKDLLVLREFSDLLAAAGQHEALADVLLEQAATMSDAHERAALHAELGQLFEEKIGDAERAMEQFQKVVELDPHYQPAVASLGRLFFRSGRFADLIELYDREIQRLEEPSQKVVRLFKVADLLLVQMGDIDAAIDRYKQILQLDPAYIPAQKALTTLLNQGERWTDLIAHYENELQHTEDRDQKVFLLDRIGTLYADKVDDLGQAILAYERTLSVATGYLPALRTLGQLYERAERWSDLIRALEQEAQATQDSRQVVALLHRSAEIHEHRLDDAERAIDVYRRVLSLAPSYLPALKSLGRLYQQRGLFQDLIDMYRQEIDVTSEASQRATLLFKIGEIQEEKLHDIEAATQAYREVLAELPSFHPALRALARVYRQTDDAAKLAEVAKLECDVLEDPAERAVARCRAALIEEIQLGTLEDAAATYRQALEDKPALADANRALSRIAQIRADVQAEIQSLQDCMAHETLPDQQRAYGIELAQRLATLSGREGEATAVLDALLQKRPQDAQLLRLALDLAVGQRDYARACELGQRLAPLLPSARAASTLWLHVAEWQRAHLDPPVDPTAAYLKVLEYEPGQREALRAVEHAYKKIGFDEGLYALYQREHELLDDGAQKRHLTLQIADLAAGAMGRIDDALRLLEQAVEADPGSTVALRRLKELYQDSGRPQDQLRILALEADASPDPEAAIRNLMEVGRLQEEQTQDKAAAADCYVKVLSKDPQHHEAFARADAIFTELDRPADLATLYHKRAAAVDGVDPKIAVLSRAAEIERDRLQRPEVALDTLREILRHSPKHVAALVAAGDLERELQHPQDAIHFYTQVVQATSDPSVTSPVFVHLGHLYADQLGDPGRAIQAFAAALNHQPNDVEVLSRLADLYIAQQSWTEASDILAKQLTFSSDTDGKLQCFHKLAQVYEQGLGNPQQAAAFLDQALALAPGAPETIERLAGLYKRAGDWNALASTLTRLLNTIPADQRDKALPMYRELAALYDGQLKQPEKAINAYASLLSVDPEDRSARFKLATLYEASPSTRDKAIEAYRELVRRAPAEPQIYKGLRRLFEAENAHDKRYVICEILHVLRATDEDESFFFDDNRKRLPQQIDYQLSDEEHERSLVHPDEQGVVRKIMRVCAGELSKVIVADLTPFGVGKSDRLTTKSNDPLRSLADQIVTALTDSKVAFDLYRCRAKTLALSVQNTDPPSLVVGSEIIRRHPNREQRFLLASLAEGLISGHHLLEGMDRQGLATFLSALGKHLQPSFTPLPHAQDEGDLPKRLGKALSRSAKRALTPLIDDLERQGQDLDLQGYLNATSLTRLRSGLLLSGDIEAVLRLVARDLGVSYNLNDNKQLGELMKRQPVMREIFVFAASEAYFRTRRLLHMAVDT